MNYFQGGLFYPLNPNGKVWKAGHIVDGVTPSGVAPSSHGLFDISDINNLEVVLDGKSDVGHQHDIVDVHPLPLAVTSPIDGGTFF